jgi:hypothetical protein
VNESIKYVYVAKNPRINPYQIAPRLYKKVFAENSRIKLLSLGAALELERKQDGDDHNVAAQADAESPTRPGAMKDRYVTCDL